MRALSIGATGMLAQQQNVEVISHNIANLNTTAFQRRRVEFQDLLYQNSKRVGVQTSDAGTVAPSGVQFGLGVETAAVYRINQQGSLSSTENPLDLAISGEGYFQIQTPNGGAAFTRAGAFQIDNQGSIVTADGYLIQPNIQVPQNAIAITVNSSGQVLATLDGVLEPQNVGQITLANFANESGLEAIGDNLFITSPSSGAAIVGNPGAAGFGQIRQGFLETSNVNAVEEITQLITAQRAYELNSKVIEAADQMLQSASNIR